MSSQITFYKKNIIDLSKENVTLTVTDAVATNNGQDFVKYVRNRKNTSAWLTTDSTDAANTTIEIDWTDSFSIDTIMLLQHNLEAYTIQYWNGSAYVDFSTAISESSNALDNNKHEFNSVATTKIKLIITGCQGGSDIDKRIAQIIITESLGQFNAWPTIKKPISSKNKKLTKMLSGKINVIESVGFFSCSLEVKNLKDSTDLDLVETIYNRGEGVLVSLNGFDETQFSSVRQGYRNEDVFLMRPIDEYNPEFYKSLYQSGIKFQMKLSESIS